MDESGKNKILLKGTLILTISGIVVKVIGSLNWVFLSRILGGEGIGLYQMGFPIYLLALTLSSAGIPVAISIVTAEKLAKGDYCGARQVFELSRRVLFITGALCMFLMTLGAGWLVKYEWIRDERAFWSIIALAPAVFLVTFMSSMRGYLQGWQKMAPTAASEIIEQLFRVITMLFFAWLLLPLGLSYGAAGASMGAAAGALMALLLLSFCVQRLHRLHANRFIATEEREQESSTELFKRLLRLALPISAASLMLPIVANLDMLIVPQRLEVAGYNTHKATELFGYLTGMAVPLINLATLLTAALSIALVPAIATARTAGDEKDIADKAGTAFRIAVAVTVPCAVGLFLLAEPVASVVYNSPGAATVIGASSMAIFFLGLHQVSTGILQGLGLTRIPVLAMIAAAAVKVVLNWQLVAEAPLAIKGAAYATVADMALAALINMFFIWRYTGFVLEMGVTLRVFGASLVMAGGIFLASYSQAYIGNWFLLLAVFLGAGIYMPLVLFTGGLPWSDAAQVPILGRYCDTLRERYLQRGHS